MKETLIRKKQMCRSALEYPPHGKRCNKSAHLTPAQQEAKRLARNKRQRELYQLKKKSSAPATGIDFNNLHDKSYLDYGFQEVGDNYFSPLGGYVDTSESSKEQMSHLSAEEKAAFRMWTSGNYRWINGVLYEGEAGLSNTGIKGPWVYSEDIGDTYFTEERMKLADGDEAGYSHTKVKNPTMELHSEVVSHLDAAFSKLPKSEEPVILYRGISVDNPAFRPYKFQPLKDGSTPHTGVKGWLEHQNLEPGKVLEFDGYLSGSQNPGPMTDWCNAGGGVAMVIRSSSSAHLEHVTEHEGEDESVLNRGSRLMVVGIERDKFMRKPVEGDTSPNPRYEAVIHLVHVDENNNPI